MTRIDELHARLMAAFGLDGFEVPTAFVKIYSHGDEIPAGVADCYSDEETVTSCQAARHAARGHQVLLTQGNVGCVAAAISLGLVDQDSQEPLPGRRIYTCVMHERKNMAPEWKPPSPRDFTSGRVYACQESPDRDDFCLFEDDSGRFKDTETARKAISQMTAIQPPTTQAVFFYGPGFEEAEVEPDIIILEVRPVELSRLVQGYSYLTGERVRGDMGAVRAVNSDLIARPYLSGEINVTTYCLGARLLARFGGGRMGMAIPLAKFETLVLGMEQSMTGYPFQLYPGARGEDEKGR